MPYQSDFLFRTCLSDNGTLPSPTYCWSPDIIAHEKISNATIYFSGNYDSDPSKSLSKTSTSNYLYTRVKGLRNGETSGYIRLYRASSSLFMNSDQWRNNKLSLENGDQYIELKTNIKDEIVAANRPFVVDGTHGNYCLVGIANTTTDETIPDVFSTYNSFVDWVKNTQGICVRNLDIVDAAQSDDYNGSYRVDNPEGNRFIAFNLIAENMPIGTVIGMSCPLLSVEKSVACTSPSMKMADAANIDPEFSGNIEVYARLPKGKTWPAGADFDIEYYVYTEAPMNESMFKYGVPVNNIIDIPANLDMNSSGRLVRIGNCGVIYKSR